MAICRKAPTCNICGETIKGKYRKTSVPFCGDTFLWWDYDGHKCRLGVKYFIERADNNTWWQGQGVWTNSPTAAMMWETSVEAEEYLKTTTEISARLHCTVTEHEFVTHKLEN